MAACERRSHTTLIFVDSVVFLLCVGAKHFRSDALPNPYYADVLYFCFALVPIIFEATRCRTLTTLILFTNMFLTSSCTTLGVVPALKENDATLFKLMRVDA